MKQCLGYVDKDDRRYECKTVPEGNNRRCPPCKVEHRKDRGRKRSAAKRSRNRSQLTRLLEEVQELRAEVAELRGRLVAHEAASHPRGVLAVFRRRPKQIPSKTP